MAGLLDYTLGSNQCNQALYMWLSRSSRHKHAALGVIPLFFITVSKGHRYEVFTTLLHYARSNGWLDREWQPSHYVLHRTSWAVCCRPAMRVAVSYMWNDNVQVTSWILLFRMRVTVAYMRSSNVFYTITPKSESWDLSPKTKEVISAIHTHKSSNTRNA